MPIQVGDMTLYTVQDLSEMLGVSASTIRAYIREERLMGRKIARRWYVPDESVQAYFSNLNEPRPESQTPTKKLASLPAPEVAPPPIQKNEPPSAPAALPLGSVETEWEQLLRQAERLKREAERVERLYLDEEEELLGGGEKKS